MTDNKDILRYDKHVESALRGVVRKAVEEIIEFGGLPGEHHFYITFMTDYKGVSIPDYLRERYPVEMTIVLQYQFSGLYVDQDKMGVTLFFNNKPEPLTIPLSAITIFADPSVNFALQFQPLGDDLPPELDALTEDDFADEKPKKEVEQKRGEVVSLDQFRKKDE